MGQKSFSKCAASLGMELLLRARGKCDALWLPVQNEDPPKSIIEPFEAYLWTKHIGGSTLRWPFVPCRQLEALDLD